MHPPIYQSLLYAVFVLSTFLQGYLAYAEAHVRHTPKQVTGEPNLRNIAPDPLESLAAPGAFAGTAAVRCDVAAPSITEAKLLRNGLGIVTFTGR